MSQTNDGRKAFTAGTALVRAVRVKLSADTVIVTGDGESGIGVTTESADSGAPVNVRLNRATQEVKADGAIAINDPIYSAAAGAGSANVSGAQQGIALQAAADGETFEMLPVG